jgi:hypothetical protein
VSTRALYLASTPMIALLAAAVARQRPGPHRLVLIEDFAQADRFAALLQRWRDCPFDAIERLPGRYTEHQRGSGDHPRGLAQAWHRARVKRELRRGTLARLAALDAGFAPAQVWVGNDRKVETQYALHLACRRTGSMVGHYLDDGLYTYLGDVRNRPLVRRLDRLVKRMSYGRWWHYADQSGTSPWIGTAWLAFPELARDQSPRRVRRALDPAWLQTRAFARLGLLAAREFGLDRHRLTGARLVLVLPHSNQFALNGGLVEGLRALVGHAADRGLPVALKYHPRERESDPGGLRREGTTIELPPLLPMELLLMLLAPGTVLVGEGSTALLAGHWLRPDLRVFDLGFSRDGYAARARTLFAGLGLASLDGQPAGLLGQLATANGAASPLFGPGPLRRLISRWPSPASPSDRLKNDHRGRLSRRRSGAGPDGLTANQRLAPLLRHAAMLGLS